MKELTHDEYFEGIQLKQTPEALLDLREQMILQFNILNESVKKINNFFEEIGESLYTLNIQKFYRTPTDIKYIDRCLWKRLVKIYDLEKYMLSADYKKMNSDLKEYQFDDFTKENVYNWLTSLKSIIYDNIKKVIKCVYQEIISAHYYTGSSSSLQKKKRNNSGIDKCFILTTYDYKSSYRNDVVSITDDLEKACYLLDGKVIPEITLKKSMYQNEVDEGQNEYFKLKFCKNGNTHYEFINDDILNKLNKFGPEGNEIGEDIKIKVFERN